MKDIIKKYHKHKLFTNLNIVLVSLVMAIWINFFLVDWTQIWQNLKASVLNTQVNENLSDISIENIDNSLYIVANRNMSKINNLSFSISYNQKNVTISDINSEIWDIVNLSNTPWINSIILSTDILTNIKVWDKIVKISHEKTEQVSENINLSNANFTDWDGKHKTLSTSWITF
jgi:hypothetical protein